MSGLISLNIKIDGKYGILNDVEKKNPGDLERQIELLEEKRIQIKQAEERIMARRSALLAGGFGNMIIREEARLDVLYKEYNKLKIFNLLFTTYSSRTYCVVKIHILHCGIVIDLKTEHTRNALE